MGIGLHVGKIRYRRVLSLGRDPGGQVGKKRPGYQLQAYPLESAPDLAKMSGVSASPCLMGSGFPLVTTLYQAFVPRVRPLSQGNHSCLPKAMSDLTKEDTWGQTDF